MTASWNCPFCGHGEPSLIEIEDDGITYYATLCDHCGAQGPVSKVSAQHAGCLWLARLSTLEPGTERLQ